MKNVNKFSVVLKNSDAFETHSAAHDPTKLRECAEQGMYVAKEFRAIIRACSPVYKADMLAALSYDCPLQFFISMPTLSNNKVTASSNLPDL